MKLDYSIERDSDRCAAITELIDSLEKDPTPTELEQMASYILYGKDENGQNAIQRNECTDSNKKYKSYLTKGEKVQSLDEIMEAPSFDERDVRSAYKREAYVAPKPAIIRPKYDKRTGELIDPGDSDVPGMCEQWETIERWQRMLDVALGKVAPNESDTLITNSFRIYQLKHNLIDMRKQQYWLKDAYKPRLHFQNLDRPKTQFYDWTGDSQYWISREEWQHRVSTSYTSRISKDINDYETRGEGDQLEVKWVICEHTFDWENPRHIRAFINQYPVFYDAMHEKLNTYGCALLWDFDRYVSYCGFSELRLFLIEMRKLGVQYDDLLEEIEARFHVHYSPNYLVSIVTTEIPNKIAKVAQMMRIDQDTPPKGRKTCIHCGKNLPAHLLFFSCNNSHKDKLSNVCKECDRINRIKRGVINKDGDLRKKDPTLH